jgi:V8-like Glu-specific endopeptidase
MLRHLGKTTLILLMFVCLHEVMAAPKARVIYGNDDRLDYYEVQDPLWKASADSTVALIRAADLSDNNGITTIVTVPYGQVYQLCPSERFWSQQSAAICSGFLVRSDLVVTAGHCISSQDDCDKTRMVLGFQITDPNSLPHTVATDQVYSCAKIVHTVSVATGEDFAVVKLDRPVTQVPPLLYRTSGKIGVGESLHVIGYPYGLPAKLAGGATVRAVQSEFLTANLDTFGGNSGSAVFNSVTGEVEGILVRGENDFVFQGNCRVSNRCPDGGCRGEDVTLFERVLPYLDP